MIAHRRPFLWTVSGGALVPTGVPRASASAAIRFPRLRNAVPRDGATSTLWPMRRLTVLVSAAVLTLTSACTGEGSDDTEAADPAELVQQAGEAFADAGTVAFTLDSEGVPDDVNGVSAADGSGVIDATEPKFAGSITGRVQGVTGSLEVIAIGQEAWMKFFTPGYEPVDLATLGAPNPALFFHPTDGLPSLLAATTDLASEGQKRQGSEIINEVSGSLPAAPVKELLELGDGTGEYDAVYGITEDGELRTIEVTGDFYEGATATYSIVVKDYGKSVEITRP